MAATDSPSNPSSSYLSKIFSSIRVTTLNLFSTFYDLFDALLPPSRRAEAKKQLTSFFEARPLLASFIYAQILFSGIPLLFFIIQIASIVIFSFTTALVIASLCALLFTGLCVGLALIVLVPILLGTVFLGVSVWGWGWVGWWALKTFGVVRASSSSSSSKSSNSGVEKVKTEEIQRQKNGLESLG
ncbi:hypothetical protein FQN57_005268 [Myotisia sp. PD_48]|nr:hypothetical protein FQN57_005268 [Myotisia sp. PD_48]